MLILISAACLTAAHPASAADDLFHSGSATDPSKTPWVTNESPGRSDLFTTQPQPAPQDMYGRTPHTDEAKGQDMLSTDPGQLPQDQLYKAPKNGIYR